MNTIAYNGEDGVAIEGTAPANTLVRNLIFVNGTSTDDVGIDLDADGVTANDGDDVDSGPNDLLNHPLITAVDTAAGTVGWTLDGLESTNYRLEFYASPFCDGSGSGEGQHYLGYVNVNTNSKGWVRHDGDRDAPGHGRPRHDDGDTQDVHRPPPAYDRPARDLGVLALRGGVAAGPGAIIRRSCPAAA